MKTFLRLLFWLLLASGLLVFAWFATRPEPPIVAVHTVGRGRVESTVANTRAGTVCAPRRAKLAPSLGGQVARLCVKEGDRVSTGQTLIELWHGDLDAQLALARSELARAEAATEQAKLHAELAEREAARQESLQAQDISAAGSTDRVTSQAKIARATERATAAELLSKQNQIACIEAQLSRMVVKAPFDGIVAEVNGEIGEFVTPSPVGIPTPPAVDLIDAGRPYVTAPIDEVDAARVRVGMSATITMDAFGKQPFVGVVRRIAPYVMDREKQARTVDVEVDFAEVPKDMALLPGYSADVEILIDARDDVVRVPTESLREGGKVLTIGVDGVLGELAIEPGLANWRFTEVAKGLQPGDRIVGSLDQKGIGAGTKVRVEGQNGAGGGQRP